MFALAHNTEMIAPNEKETEIARTSQRVLAGLDLDNTQNEIHIHLHTTDNQDAEFVLPLAAVRLLLNGLQEMAKGNAVSLVPIQAELTTQQAAELLCVSRPYFIKLLEEGKIPYRTVGIYRRVKAADVLAYIREYQEQATRDMNELAEEAQRLGLY
ncbi:MAG: excisionase family DNA-binding protein [Armatimonadetes bacterium]|nr:excisionase family DNA-binding protein [Armatimonadota bacterium]